MGLPAKELTFREVRRFESSHLRQRRSSGAIPRGVTVTLRFLVPTF